MLAFVYVVLTAPPVSLRRLVLLYVVTLTVAALAVSALGVHDRMNWALAVSVGITGFFWIVPLVALVVGIVQKNPLALLAFDRVSGGVQWTYGFAIIMVALVVARALFAGTFSFTIGGLFHDGVVASLGGLGLPVVLQLWRKRRQGS